MQSLIYNTPGVYNFVVPQQCTSIAVTVRGAAGAGGTVPGQGGSVAGTLTVTPGETLVLTVGGKGVPSTSTLGGAGGFNGGGAGGSSGSSGTSAGGHGGGGASDIRRGGTALSNRKAVGAGGGGAGRGTVSTGPGGDGGTTTGESGLPGGNTLPTVAGTAATGGTQSAGGAAGAVGGSGFAGALGVGGLGGGGGGTSVGDSGGGGGGAGYYGGGGGGGTNHNPSGSGSGAGGSNYAGGLASVAGNVRGDWNGDGLIQLTFNSPPNAPSLVNPPNNSFVDSTLATEFDWLFSDPDPTDTQASYTFRWRTGTGAWTTVGPTTSTGQTFTTGAGAWTSLAGTQVEWQMMVTDSEAATSLWSASSFFTPQTEPSAPTVTATSIPSQTPSATFTTPAPMVAYQAITVIDISGSPDIPANALADTTEIDVTGNPSAGIATLPVFSYINGNSYHILVRFQQYPGVWSPYGDSGPLVADVNAPIQPSCTLGDNSSTGTIVVTITNPSGDPFAPDYNDIYRTDVTRDGDEIRIATQVDVNGTYLDTRAGFNTEYRYRIVAVTDEGATTSSL